MIKILQESYTFFEMQALLEEAMQKTLCPTTFSFQKFSNSKISIL
jgi:hypothetical protein